MGPDADHLESLKLFAQMPSAPPLWRRIDAVVGEERDAPGRLAALVSTDPVLTAEFVRDVHGGGTSGLAFRELLGAIQLRGITGSKRLILATLVKHGLVDWARPGSRLDRPTWWRHSVGTALAAGQIATLIKGASPKACHCAGLFHDAGILAVDWLAPQLLMSVGVPGEAADMQAPDDTEERILGVAHVDFGRAMAANWAAPESALEGVSKHHAPLGATAEHRAVACIVCVADVLMSPAGAWWYGGGPEEEYRNALFHLRLEEHRLERVRDRVESELEQLSGLLLLPTRH